MKYALEFTERWYTKKYEGDREDFKSVSAFLGKYLNKAKARNNAYVDRWINDIL